MKRCRAAAAKGKDEKKLLPMLDARDPGLGAIHMQNVKICKIISRARQAGTGQASADESNPCSRSLGSPPLRAFTAFLDGIMEEGSQNPDSSSKNRLVPVLVMLIVNVQKAADTHKNKDHHRTTLHIKGTASLPGPSQLPEVSKQIMKLMKEVNKEADLVAALEKISHVEISEDEDEDEAGEGPMPTTIQLSVLNMLRGTRIVGAPRGALAYRLMSKKVKRAGDGEDEDDDF